MPVVFTDGSARNNLLDIGIHWEGALLWLAVSKTISTPKILDSHAAELVAIDCALSQILHSVQCGGTGPPITIFSDSQEALQALRNPCPRSGQVFDNADHMKSIFPIKQTSPQNGVLAILTYQAMIRRTV